MEPLPTISRFDAVRIAAVAVCDPRAVRRAYAGHSHLTTRERVVMAARALGLPEPAPPEDRDKARPPATSGDTPSKGARDGVKVTT